MMRTILFKNLVFSSLALIVLQASALAMPLPREGHPCRALLEPTEEVVAELVERYQDQLVYREERDGFDFGPVDLLVKTDFLVAMKGAYDWFEFSEEVPALFPNEFDRVDFFVKYLEGLDGAAQKKVIKKLNDWIDDKLGLQNSEAIGHLILAALDFRVVPVRKAVASGEDHPLVDKLRQVPREIQKEILNRFATVRKKKSDEGGRQYTVDLDYLRFLPRVDREEKINLFGIALGAALKKEEGWNPGMSNYTREIFEALTRDESIHVVMTALRMQAPGRMVRNRPDREAAIERLLSTRPRGKDLEELDQLLLELDPLYVIVNYTIRDRMLTRFFELHLRAEGEEIGIETIFDEFARTHPEQMAEGFAQSLFWDRTTDVETVRALLKFYYHELPSRKDLARKGPPRNSLELLTWKTGLDYEVVADSRVHRNPGEAFRLILDIQKGMPKPVFEGVKFDRDVFERRGVWLEFSNTVRNFLANRFRADFTPEQRWEVWNGLVELLELNREGHIVSANEMEGFAERIQEVVEQEVIDNVRRTIQETTGQEIEFSYQDYMRIIEEWGDIEPVTTLLSRFSQGQTDELPIILDVLKASLAGRFKEYKFGENLSDPQINFIPEAQREEWVKNRYRVGLVDEGLRPKDTLVVESFNRGDQIFRNDVAPLEEVLFAEPMAENRSEWFFALEEAIQTGRPKDVVVSFINDLNVESTTALKELVFTGLKMIAPESEARQVEGVGPMQVRSWARVMIGAIAMYREIEENSPAEWNQLSRSLKEFVRPLRFDMARIASSGFVFSSLSSDPKLLLTVGDVVDCQSCQNYRTGGIIRTLPGYVIDANTRALTSFHLAGDQFERQADYLRVFEAIWGHEAIELSWNGNRRRIKFQLDDGTEIYSKDLGHGYLRNIVRVGRTDEDQPSLRMERDYRSGHPGMGVMNRFHQEIFQEVTDAIGANNHSNALFVASKNPQGTYSDLGGGSKLGDFQIPRQN